jgi:hypothetical protein
MLQVQVETQPSVQDDPDAAQSQQQSQHRSETEEETKILSMELESSRAETAALRSQLADVEQRVTAAADARLREAATELSDSQQLVQQLRVQLAEAHDDSATAETQAGTTALEDAADGPQHATELQQTVTPVVIAPVTCLLLMSSAMVDQDLACHVPPRLCIFDGQPLN